jgi:hypothetical protein
MSDTPEHIWINDTPNVVCGSFDTEPFDGSVEYIRAHCIKELERERVLNDGRPCVTDVFLAAAIEQLDDKWDFFEAVKCWCEGDWAGALEGIKLAELEGKDGRNYNDKV